MKALIDTNILLDVLAKREPLYKSSLQIWRLCELGQIDGYISALSFTNILYIMRKSLDPDLIEKLQRSLSLIFHFTDLTVDDIEAASGLHWSDFEDALQYVSGKRVHVDCIITRNKLDYQEADRPAITPEEYLEQ